MIFVRLWRISMLLLLLSGCSLTASLDNLLSAAKQNPVRIDTNLPPINSVNEGHYPLTGTCDDNHKEFNITAPSTIAVSCIDGTWTVVIDFTLLPDGPVKVVTDIKDSAGNPVQFELQKDTVAPVVSALTLAAGAVYTKDTVLPFSISHTDGHQIYLTNTPGCASGGSWSLLASTTLTNIGSAEGVQSVYAKVRDLAGNESSCVSDSITLDITPPVVTGLANDSTPAKTKSWTWSCTDIGTCKYRFVIDQTAATSPSGSFSSATTATQSSGDGAYYIHVQAEDEAGNVGTAVHYSAVLDNTGPALTIGTASPTTGNSASTFQWVISFTGAASISLADSDITLSGTATAGCVASVTGSGTTSRTVSVTGCSGNGTIGISVAANTALDTLGNASVAAGPSSTATVNNVAPTYSVSSVMPSTGVAATVFEWTVTYVGADTITLSSGDIQYSSVTGTGSQNCAASVSTVSTLVRKIQVTGCSGDGTFRLRIIAGSASNTAGNTAAAFTSSEAVLVYNTPVIQTFNGDVGYSYKTTDTPVLSWSAQPERGTAPAKYELAIGTNPGGTQVMGWTDLGLVTTYVRTDLSLSYSSTYYAQLRLTDTAGKVSAVRTFNFRPSWAGPSATAYPEGEIYTTAKDSSGRRIVGGNFSQIILPINNASYLTGTAADGTYFSITHPLNGLVNKQIEQPDGKIILLGSFTHAGTVDSRYIARLNADGSFDSSFAVQNGLNSMPSAVALQSDGKILLGGEFTFYKGVSAPRMIRLNSDGTRDLTFNVGTGFNSSVVGLAVQPDGKILAGGYFTTFNGSSLPYLVRLNADGSLDSSFNTGTGFNNYVTRVLIQSDGKIVVGGNFKTINGTSRAVVARLNANGSLDTSFGGGVGFGHSGGASISIYAKELLQDAAGKFYVSGYFNRYDGAAVTAIVRLNNDGTRDTGFSMALPIYTINAMAVQGTKLLVADRYSSGGQTSTLLRLTSSGALDSSFKYDQGDLDHVVNSILVRNSDGLVWLGGQFTSRRHTVDQRGIARFNTDGTLDTSFVTRIEALGFNKVGKVIVQTDGKILVQGDFQYYDFTFMPGVLRLNADGTLDSSFNPPMLGGVNTMAIRTDQKIYIGGSFDTNAGYSKVALLNTDGSVDYSFSWSGNDTLNGDVTSLGVLSDGNVLIGGKFSAVGITPVKPLIIVSSTGTLDTSFIWSEYTTETGFEVLKIEIDKAGEALVAVTYDDQYPEWNSGTGSYDYLPTSSVRVVRMDLSGATYESINFDGGATPSYFNAMATQPDGKILVSISSRIDSGGPLLRLSSGSDDLTFNARGFYGATCISAESNTSIFVVSGTQFWKSRGIGNIGMNVISP